MPKWTNGGGWAGGIIKPVQTGVPVIWLLDANARVGSEPTDHVGEYSPDPENQSGAAFHAALRNHQVRSPSTFEERAQTLRPQTVPKVQAIAPIT
eukprot:2086775-Alexandrium_andersonii.AAC.1